MKEKIKNMKGITLVALIITIIVLLILAVVAITSINNNKIIEYAKNGRDSYNQKATNEKDKMDEYEQYLDTNNPNKSNSGNKEITFYCIEDNEDLVVFKFKNNNKVDILAYNFNGEELNAEEYDGILGKDVYSYTVSGGKYYLIIKDVETGEESKEECTVIKLKDYNLLYDSEEVIIGYDNLPPVTEELIGKKYTDNNGNTYTLKSYTVKGINFMNLYEYNKDENKYIIVIDNTVYEIGGKCFDEFGTINLDKTSSDYGKITGNDNTIYQIKDS